MLGVGRKVCVQNVKAVEQQSLWVLGIKESMPKNPSCLLWDRNSALFCSRAFGHVLIISGAPRFFFFTRCNVSNTADKTPKLCAFSWLCWVVFLFLGSFLNRMRLVEQLERNRFSGVLWNVNWPEARQVVQGNCLWAHFILDLSTLRFSQKENLSKVFCVWIFRWNKNL